MANVEITIKELGKPDVNISAKGIQVCDHFLGKTIYLSEAFYAGGLVTQPQPSFDRQQVLREEYEPEYKGDYYTISGNNAIEFRTNYHRHFNVGLCPYAFAPSKELAEEIVSIRNGKWLPKGKDIYWWVNPEFNEQSFKECIAPDFASTRRDGHYFPSLKQMQTFIDKHKPKEGYQIIQCNECRNGYNHKVGFGYPTCTKEEPKSYEIGNSVYLKPNAMNQHLPLMTIHQIAFNDLRYQCRWFEEKTLCSDWFFHDELILWTKP